MIAVNKFKYYCGFYGIKGRINLVGGETLLFNNINEIIDYIQ